MNGLGLVLGLELGVRYSSLVRGIIKCKSVNCRLTSCTGDSAVDMDASTSTELGNLPPPLDIPWHPIAPFYYSNNHGLY